MDPEKPSKNEDEYFLRKELERKKEWEKERAAKMKSEERETLRQLHHMKCPKCGMDLHPIEISGIKLDRCVSCNGTWFDEGEIEALAKGNEGGSLSRIRSLFQRSDSNG